MNHSEVKNFLKVSIVFLLPLLFLTVAPFVFFYQTGEFRNEADIITKQNEGAPILYGKGYITSGAHDSLKLQSLLLRTPEVLVLGTSRTLQFRSKFFNEKHTFYNAGGLVNSADDFLTILKLLPEAKLPKLLIVGLDQTFFRAGYENEIEHNSFENPEEHVSLNKLFFSWRQFYFDSLQRKFNPIDAFSSPRNADVEFVGAYSILNHSGIFNDGSFNYGTQYSKKDLPDAEDYHFKDSLKRIETGTRRFEYASELSASAIGSIEELLDFAKKNKIHVVAFIPPYAHVVYEEILKYGTKYEYMKKIMPNLTPIFSKYDYNVFDFTDLALLGASDKETVDGFHASEKAYLRLFIKMAELDPKLNSYIDLEYLKMRLSNESGYLEVFRFEI